MPHNWKRKTLAEIVGDDGLLMDGDWIETKDQDPNGNVRLIQLADVGDGAYANKSARFMTFERAQELRCTFLDRNDILVARMPDPLGRACLFPGDAKKAVTVVDICIVRPGDSVDRRWLLDAINESGFRRSVQSRATGTTRVRISRKHLSRIHLAVPPIGEQRRIAEVLVSIDTAIERTRAVIDQVRVVKQALLADLMTNGLPGRHKKFKTVKGLGRIPFQWDVVRLDEVVKLSSGNLISVRSLSSTPSSDASVPVIGGNGVAGYGSVSLVQEPVIAIGRVGEYCGVVHFVEGPAWITDNALYTKEVLSEMDLRFLATFLQYHDLRRYSSRTGQPLVTQSSLAGVKIPVCQSDEAIRIVECASAVAKRLHHEQFALAQLMTVKQALSDALLTGRIRVIKEKRK